MVVSPVVQPSPPCSSVISFVYVHPESFVSAAPSATDYELDTTCCPLVVSLKIRLVLLPTVLSKTPVPVAGQ